MKRTVPSASLCLHQPLLVLIQCCVKSNIQSFCPSCCITWYIIDTSDFLFKCRNLICCSGCWKWPCLGPLKHFWVFFSFIISICCLYFWMFASRILCLLAVLRQFIFARLLVSIGWNFTSYLCLNCICSIFTDVMYEL